MNKELVRFKYKKDIINCIEESWDYYGEEDEQRKVIKEIKNVYKIASSAKNAPKPEYEAKAKAYDDIRYAMEMQTAIDVSDEDTLIEVDHVIMSLIERMESGGSDD